MNAIWSSSYYGKKYVIRISIQHLISFVLICNTDAKPTKLKTRFTRNNEKWRYPVEINFVPKCAKMCQYCATLCQTVPNHTHFRHFARLWYSLA